MLYQSPLPFPRRSSSSARRPLISAENYLARLKSAILHILASQKLRRQQKGRNAYLYWLPLCEGKKGRSVPIDHSTLQLPSLNELVKVPLGAVPCCKNQKSLEGKVSSICSSFYVLHSGTIYVSFDECLVTACVAQYLTLREAEVASGWWGISSGTCGEPRHWYARQH